MNLLPVLKEFTYWEYLASQEIADFTFQQLLLIAVVTSIQLEFKIILDHLLALPFF